MAQDILSVLLGEVNSAGDTFSNSILSAITGVNKNAAKTQQSFVESINRNKAMAGATQVVAATRNAADLQAQTSMREFSLAGETDIEDITGKQRKLAEEYNAFFALKNDKLAQIREKTSISPFDDPIGWLEAQLTIDPIIREHNILEKEADARKEQLVGMNAMVDARYSAVQKLKLSTSAAASAAATQLAVDAVNEHGAEIQRQALTADSERVGRIANLSGMRLEAKSKLLSAESEAERLRMARAQFKASMKEHAMNLDRLRAGAKDEKDKEALLIHDLTAVRRGMEISGVDPAQIAAMDNINVRAMLKGQKVIDPQIAQFYNMGVENLYAGYRAGSGIVANDPVTAASRVRNLNIQLPESARNSLKLVQQAERSLKASRGLEMEALAAKKDFAGINALVNAEAQRLLDADSQRAGDPSSVYYLPDVKSISEAIPGLQQMAGFRKVLAPLIAADSAVKLDSPKLVAATFRDAIRKGDVTFEEARAAMQAIYAQGQALNFATKQLVRLGFTPKLTYISESATGDLVNYADYNDVGKVLMYRYQFGTGAPFAR